MPEFPIREFIAVPKPEEFKFIEWKTDDGVARLTLRRPPYNVLNTAMLQEIAVSIESLADAAEVKCLVIRSACDRVFCGGIDPDEYSAPQVFQMIDAFHHIFVASIEASKATIVAVDGAALGGGCELAALGDIVLATPRARFALPEITKLGIFPPFAATLFPSILGARRTMEMVLTGDTMTAEQAQEYGLVNRVVPEKDLEGAVEELVAKLSQQSGPVLQLTKRAILEAMGKTFRDALRNTEDIFLNELSKLEDPREGLRAVLEKRKPKWKNR